MFVKFMISLLILFSFVLNDTIYVKMYDSNFNPFEKEFIRNVLNLYKLKQKKSFQIKFIQLNSFDDLFKFDPEKKMLSISAITITKKRLKGYDFSIGYFPIKQAVLTTAAHKNLDWGKKGVILGFIKDDFHSQTVLELKKNYPIITKEIDLSSHAASLIGSGKIDVFISDISSAWTEHSNLIVLDSTNPYLHVSNYGILYPKGSDLKIELDKIINYYIRSSSYYSLIRRHFGKRAYSHIRAFNTK